MKKIILLDFDGTIADTAGVIVTTMQATIAELHLPARSDEECASTIGLRLEEIPGTLFKGGNIDSAEFASTYRRIFHAIDDENAVPLYPNVRETLHALKEMGITLTIASSRSRASLLTYIERLNLVPYISYVVGGNDVTKGKPAPDAVNKTLSALGFSTDDALMVGDTAYDILMGHNAGIETCGVTYGNGTRLSLTESKADYIIDDFAQLLQIAEQE